MTRVAVARNAMATRFEIVLFGKDATSLRAAGEEALNEIERLEAQLSLYRPSSEIANINARAARGAVHVAPSLFRLLEHAKRLSQETGGAFDLTVAPLMRAWGLMGGKGKVPTRSELADARACVGMHLIELDPKNFTIRFAHHGLMLDLGAIGKGYAIDQAVETLREAGVSKALVHGGTSTAYGLGGPWKIGIESEKEDPVALVELEDTALSVSAAWGKSFSIGKKTYGHVIDPRTGRPVQRALLAAVILPSATETDALSTALLILGKTKFNQVTQLRPGMRALVVDSHQKIATTGIVPHPLS